MFLTGNHLKTCHAVKGIVVLSSLELKLLCESGTFEDCPVFQAYVRKRGIKIEEREYSVMFSRWAGACRERKEDRRETE
jgi:hypothetical protein